MRCYTRAAAAFAFAAQRAYHNPAVDVDLRVTFAGPAGERYDVPAFWDGGHTWKVRFAPIAPGTWSFATVSTPSDDLGLHGRKEQFDVHPASGDNPLYLHGGQLKVSADKRTLTYSDGTPFFWLGDTWWFAPSQLVPFEGSSNAGVPLLQHLPIYQSVEWWELEPRPDAIKMPAGWPEMMRVLVKADRDATIVIYFPRGLKASMPLQLQTVQADANVALGVNAYTAQWINPRSGERQAVTGSGLPDRPDAEDWASPRCQTSRRSLTSRAGPPKEVRNDWPAARDFPGDSNAT